MSILKLTAVSLFGLFILVGCGSESSGSTETDVNATDIDSTISGVATAAKISVVTAK